jgi:anti-sigma regulatory factor (Ser/Thr protein kinase)
MDQEVDEKVEPNALQLLVPGDPGLVAAARQRLARWLGELGIAHDDRFGIVLACSEALAIAMERVPSSGAIALDATHRDGALTARVRDFTPWSGPARSPDRVRRLLLIARLTDWFDVGYTAAGGEVRLSWKPQPARLVERANISEEPPPPTLRPRLRLASQLA